MVITLVKGPVFELIWTKGRTYHEQQQGGTNLQHPIKGSIMIFIGCFSWACFMILQVKCFSPSYVLHEIFYGSHNITPSCSPGNHTKNIPCWALSYSLGMPVRLTRRRCSGASDGKGKNCHLVNKLGRQITSSSLQCKNIKLTLYSSTICHRCSDFLQVYEHLWSYLTNHTGIIYHQRGYIT